MEAYEWPKNGPKPGRLGKNPSALLITKICVAALMNWFTGTFAVLENVPTTFLGKAHYFVYECTFVRDKDLEQFSTVPVPQKLSKRSHDGRISAVYIGVGYCPCMYV